MKLTERELLGEQVEERRDVLRFKDGHVYERYVAPHRVGSRTVGRVASFRDIGPSVRTAEALEQHQQFLEQAQEVAHIGSWVAELDGSEPAWLVGGNPSHLRRAARARSRARPTRSTRSFTPTIARRSVTALSAPPSSTATPYDIEHRVVRPRRHGPLGARAGEHPPRRGRDGRDPDDRDGAGHHRSQRQLEDQLRQSQKMEAIGRLAGGIAHDLNNALTAIAGYAELALGEVKSGHPARPDVEEIRRAAERAGSVTRQLLAFSRKQLLEPRIFDLNDTITRDRAAALAAARRRHPRADAPLGRRRSPSSAIPGRWSRR